MFLSSPSACKQDVIVKALPLDQRAISGTPQSRGQTPVSGGQAHHTVSS